MKKIYTDEMYSFIKANINGTRVSEMTKLVNEKYGLNISLYGMKSYLNKNKLKNGLKHNQQGIKRKVLFSEEQKAFLLENYIGKSNQELTDLINNRFNTTFTLMQIKRYKNNHKLNSGLTGYFEKGHISFNKGKRMSAEQYEKCKATMFKKGSVPANHSEIGTETVTKDGYIKIKIEEPNVWKYKHIHIWEKHYGKKVPKGSCITFLDGNKRNFYIDNLTCITLDENARLNKNSLRSEVTEITQVNINIVRLDKKIKDIKTN